MVGTKIIGPAFCVADAAIRLLAHRDTAAPSHTKMKHQHPLYERTRGQREVQLAVAVPLFHQDDASRIHRPRIGGPGSTVVPKHEREIENKAIDHHHNTLADSAVPPIVSGRDRAVVTVLVRLSVSVLSGEPCDPKVLCFLKLEVHLMPGVQLVDTELNSSSLLQRWIVAISVQS
jgi:hypothetical protein